MLTSIDLWRVVGHPSVRVLVRACPLPGSHGIGTRPYSTDGFVRDDDVAGRGSWSLMERHRRGRAGHSRRYNVRNVFTGRRHR